MKSMVLVVLVTATLAQTASIRGEDKRAEFGWRTVPSSPVDFIESQEGFRFEYVQRGPGTVAAFETGCILEQEGHFFRAKPIARTLLKDFLAKYNGVPMKGPLMVASQATKECGVKGKVGIISVDFEDGASWSLPSKEAGGRR